MSFSPPIYIKFKSEEDRLNLLSVLNRGAFRKIDYNVQEVDEAIIIDTNNREDSRKIFFNLPLILNEIGFTDKIEYHYFIPLNK